VAVGERWPLWGGGGGGGDGASYYTCFLLQGVQQVFAPTSCLHTVAYNGNPTIFNNIYG